MEPALAMGGGEKAARLPSLSSCSHISFPGDSQAGQVSGLLTRELGKCGRGGPGSHQGHGAVSYEGRKGEGQRICRILLGERLKWRVDPRTILS